MAAGITFPVELANGNTGDADEVMSNFNTIKNNLDPDAIEDASANATAMQVTTDPYPGASESLADDLRGELERLRFLIKQITGEAQWYIDPDTSILLEFNKGADIASATALALGTDGNYFDVTGTTTITSIGTRRVGSVIKLHFDDAVILTHSANLVLPADAVVVTVAGDEVEFYEYATGQWRCTNFSPNSHIVRTKRIAIGDWNMNTTVSVAVAHGLTFVDIRSISALIIHDSGSSALDFSALNFSEVSLSEILVDVTNVTLYRGTNGQFDNAAYDSTSFNRGWINITYVG